MRVGIDLDNTIINYSAVLPWVAKDMQFIKKQWSGSKLELKKNILRQDNGQYKWERTQGLAYGKYIGKAKLFNGVHRFLWLCKQREIIVDVISHKTRLGHHDKEKFLLHQQAKYFLKKTGLFDDQSKSNLISSLTFCDSQEEKLNAIVLGNYDWFIDDLVEIFNNPTFPTGTQKIIFNPNKLTFHSQFNKVSSWGSLQKLIAPNYSQFELQKFCQDLNLNSFISAKQMSGGINSTIYKIASQPQEFILKIFPQDNDTKRFSREYVALTLLRKYGFKNIPEIMAFDRTNEIMALTNLEGKKVNKPTLSMINNCLKFINQIQELKNNKETLSLQPAKDACFSIWQIMNQIDNRRNNFRILQNPPLKLFLTHEFDPLFKSIKQTVLKKITQNKSKKLINASVHILSPSDFGFHNVLVDKKNKLNFLDFEYFGWDHPLKLLIDFALHPGFTLSTQARRAWIDGSLASYAKGCEKEMNIAWPLFGLIWILIFLNNYQKEKAINNADKTNLVRQFNKAKLLLTYIKHNFHATFREVSISA